MMLDFNNAYGYLILYAVFFVFVIASGYYLEIKPKKDYRVWVASIVWVIVYTFLTWRELVRLNNAGNGFELMGWLSLLILVLYLIKLKNIREGKL